MTWPRLRARRTARGPLTSAPRHRPGAAADSGLLARADRRAANSSVAVTHGDCDSWHLDSSSSWPGPARVGHPAGSAHLCRPASVGPAAGSAACEQLLTRAMACSGPGFGKGVLWCRQRSRYTPVDHNSVTVQLTRMAARARASASGLGRRAPAATARAADCTESADN